MLLFNFAYARIASFAKPWLDFLTRSRLRTAHRILRNGHEAEDFANFRFSLFEPHICIAQRFHCRPHFHRNRFRKRKTTKKKWTEKKQTKIKSQWKINRIFMIRKQCCCDSWQAFYSYFIFLMCVRPFNGIITSMRRYVFSFSFLSFIGHLTPLIGQRDWQLAHILHYTQTALKINIRKTKIIKHIASRNASHFDCVRSNRFWCL